MGSGEEDFAARRDLRKGGHESLGIDVGGGGEDLLGWSALDDLALVEDGDALADSGD